MSHRSTMLGSALAFLLLAACGGGDSGAGGAPGPTAAFLGPCTPGGVACAAGSMCGRDGTAREICTHDCTADSDCPGGVCGTDGNGRRVCGQRCTAGSKAAYACVDGAPVTCAVAPPTECATCGCPSTQRCDPGNGCVDRSPQGAGCASDDDCQSANCGRFTGICEVAVGAVCQPGIDCELCAPLGASTYCSRECSGDSECNGGRCVGLFLEGPHQTYLCKPLCTLGFVCPDKCVDITGSSDSVCSTSDGTVAPRKEGAPCKGDAECMSGSCAAGVCASPCASDDSCPTGGVCIAALCTSGPCSMCLQTCASAGCLGGKCRTEPDVAGQPVLACDGRLPMGAVCTQAADCLTGACVAGECAGSGAGMPDGSACNASSDCASGMCANNVCRGMGIIGDPCTYNVDCSVGRCCTSGPNVLTCAQSC